MEIEHTLCKHCDYRTLVADTCAHPEISSGFNWVTGERLLKACQSVRDGPVCDFFENPEFLKTYYRVRAAVRGPGDHESDWYVYMEAKCQAYTAKGAREVFDNTRPMEGRDSVMTQEQYETMQKERR